MADLKIGNIVSPKGASMLFGLNSTEDFLNIQTPNEHTYSPYEFIYVEENDDETIPASQIIWTVTNGEKTVQMGLDELLAETQGIDTNLTNHIEDEERHITSEEREKWNNSSPKKTTIMIPIAAWQENDINDLTATINSLEVTSNTMIDVLYSSDSIELMNNSGATTLYIENDNGVLTAHLIGGDIPTIDGIISVKYYEIQEVGGE